MFIGVAERQERQEHLLVADTEIIHQHFGRARGIVQDRAMMLHHPARRAAGAAGVDQARSVVARHRGGARLGFLQIRLAAGDERRPVAYRDVTLLPDAQAFHGDDRMRVGARHRGHQRARQLGGRHDHRLGPAVVEDVLVIAFGVGGVGRHRNAARGHDREISDAPFGAVFTDQHDAVTVLQPHLAQPMRQRRDLVRDLPPAQRMPDAIGFAPQERIFTALFGAVEKHRDQTRKMVEMGIIQLHACHSPRF